uniref:Uncharacterized protein n=1 Tax=Chromera velia CCMP2878 TaxID=1169474 RepID=A0A0G4H9S6_9ALVE|eukprot:Cvel_25393.t1-p1 / transcript=Cvel_25393.t1 / gene=Cvel_25393 / organism=Chromera_velia_CCMP2878 / gene_product=hypothetical protein / transcript_product=hypothetical protein / location=Cvel_scaffold2871:10197-14331(-) / protein_length=431 / sequence_SO=supercontig / SO=protein_coding / is_pseudo=false
MRGLKQDLESLLCSSLHLHLSLQLWASQWSTLEKHEEEIFLKHQDEGPKISQDQDTHRSGEPTCFTRYVPNDARGLRSGMRLMEFCFSYFRNTHLHELKAYPAGDHSESCIKLTFFTKERKLLVNMIGTLTGKEGFCPSLPVILAIVHGVGRELVEGGHAAYLIALDAAAPVQCTKVLVEPSVKLEMEERRITADLNLPWLKQHCEAREAFRKFGEESSLSTAFKPVDNGWGDETAICRESRKTFLLFAANSREGHGDDLLLEAAVRGTLEEPDHVAEQKLDEMPIRDLVKTEVFKEFVNKHCDKAESLVGCFTDRVVAAGVKRDTVTDMRGDWFKAGPDYEVIWRQTGEDISKAKDLCKDPVIRTGLDRIGVLVPGAGEEKKHYVPADLAEQLKHPHLHHVDPPPERKPVAPPADSEDANASCTLTADSS